MSYRNFKLKSKKCKVCGTEFVERCRMQQTCSASCERERRAQKLQKKKEVARSSTKKADKSRLLKEAQIAFNAYIRRKYKGFTCASCGKEYESSFQAGHFFPVGRCSATRFDERNVFLQCEECNMMKSGNLEEYKKFLLDEIGPEEFGRLEEKSRQVKTWSEDELRDIINRYGKGEYHG